MQYTDSLPAHDAESLLVHPRRAELLKEQATGFKSVNLNPCQLCDLEMLLNRAFHPLDGYLGRKDYESVLSDMRLSDGTLWPLPICLGVSAEFAANLEEGECVAVRDAEGFMLAVLTVSDIWKPDLAAEARAIHGPEARREPVDACCCGLGEPWYIGGRVEGVSYPQRYDFTDIRLTPAEVRRSFAQKGRRKVMAVQAGRPLHRADRAMLEEIAREQGVDLLLSPQLRPSMYFSVDHFSLVRSFRQFTETFPRSMASLNLTPWFERRMGPRGALLRAVVNRNYGCTHMLVWDGAKAEPRRNILSEDYEAHIRWLADHREETGIVSVAEHCMVLDPASGKYVRSETGVRCANDHNAVVDLLTRGEPVPEWMSFPGVLEELSRTYKPRWKQGITLFLTGLSGAGKSTLAKVLFVKLLELNSRPVTLLDGDIVRTNLSSELSFSREHRNLNVTRIGFVASEIVKNGGVAICAPIAPYAESRRQAREAVEEYGGFVEIHVSTPLAACERRDRKGIYAKARAGIIKGMTGVDDPYVEPENPELRIDTSELSPDEAAHEVLLYLREHRFI
ncbi:putative bifunctional SAT/APS kinase [Pseudodesulfovibrio hydrargyri]|uniref:adenylyl-sulfate kinase n=1 Tax=Pseudodesulfovibrio hydrargyri TaxID=2125990 RepID=A0A1J5MXY9_9BACT|nr:adenylyl-sulfate kinase [Pseudodesulfovibrio hydrargyri]OIQ51390.1 putative bifunctional SAT/APS kinase [Pseudodesulfovibrio hydrargyri]